MIIVILALSLTDRHLQLETFSLKIATKLLQMETIMFTIDSL